MNKQDLISTRHRVSAALACVDRIQAFKNAMLDAGVTPPDNVIGDGNRHRFHIEGDKSGSLNGWYLLHLDGRAAGSFGCWKRGIKERWKLDGYFKPLTPAERQAFAIERQRQVLEREQKTIGTQQQAAQKARKIWKRAIYADDSNPYSYRKKVKPHGTKTGDSGGLKGVLIVPIYDESLKLVNLQFIQPDGTKRFLKGGRKQCCFWWIGRKSLTILIAEGFATAASLHEATDHQVFIAFDAGNLVNVAKIVRGRNPDAEIIICGDNDESGTGQAAAHAAALACGGKYIIPDTVGHDWNDELTADVAA